MLCIYNNNLIGDALVLFLFYFYRNQFPQYFRNFVFLINLQVIYATNLKRSMENEEKKSK